MGNRGIVRVLFSNEKEVCLYSHWTGSELAKVVQNALRKKWRWDDPSYLTRILFDAISVDHHGEEVGFGIAPGRAWCDNGHPIVVVDMDSAEIRFDTDARIAPTHPGPWTFSQYIEMSNSDIQNAFDIRYLNL